MGATQPQTLKVRDDTVFWLVLIHEALGVRKFFSLVAQNPVVVWIFPGPPGAKGFEGYSDRGFAVDNGSQ
jgi:hypothetical protein